MVRRMFCVALLAVAVCGCDVFKEPTKKVADAPAVQQEAAPAQMEQVKAGVGVGQKGSKIRGEGMNQMIAGPAIGFFNTKEKIVFEIEIPYNLEIYRALNDGNYPKSEEEFMEKVIKEYQIKLPELPPGHKYVYEVESHTLMVERPAKGDPAAPSGG